jgi:hypothetical protein
MPMHYQDPISYTPEGELLITCVRCIVARLNFGLRRPESLVVRFEVEKVKKASLIQLDVAERLAGLRYLSLSYKSLTKMNCFRIGK